MILDVAGLMLSSEPAFSWRHGTSTLWPVFRSRLALDHAHTNYTAGKAVKVSKVLSLSSAMLGEVLWGVGKDLPLTSRVCTGSAQLS